jgi:hypothetical protein
MFDNLPSNEAVYSAGSITKSQSNGAEQQRACLARLYRGDWKQPEKFPA